MASLLLYFCLFSLLLSVVYATTFRGKSLEGKMHIGNQTTGLISMPESDASLVQSDDASITVFSGSKIVIQNCLTQAAGSSITLLQAAEPDAGTVLHFRDYNDLGSEANLSSGAKSLLFYEGISLGEESHFLADKGSITFLKSVSIGDRSRFTMKSCSLCTEQAYYGIQIGNNSTVTVKSLGNIRGSFTISNNVILDVETEHFYCDSLSMGVNSSLKVDASSAMTLNVPIPPNRQITVCKGSSLTLSSTPERDLFICDGNAHNSAASIIILSMRQILFSVAFYIFK